ncbi:hypothetical protein L1049_012463 [Liquidambar formosana]|uniref:NB-ARC domain-containing protein n=1 Tax=Liquidambar formosana TaxID=63359 RepID=A0AAP0N4C2_LIQFO
MKAHALAFLEVVNAIFVQLLTLGGFVMLFVPFLQILFFPNKEKEKLEGRLEIVRATVSNLGEKQELSKFERNLLKKFEDIIEDRKNAEQELVNVNQKMAVLRYCSIVWYRIALFFASKRIGDSINDAIKDKNDFQGLVDPKDRRPDQNMPVKPLAIGREEDKKAIQERIKEYSSNGTKVLIIPIVGISGVGKTTLAKVVLKDEENFNLKMFVRFPIKDEKKSEETASPENDMEQLVKELTRAATEEKSEESNWEQPKEILQEKLKGKKYLLVLDDVWIMETDIRRLTRWKELETQLMAGEPGSLIIVTARNSCLGRAVSNTGDPYILGSLSEDNSWSLLAQLAFKSGPGEEKPELQDVGKEILQKCGGNPLAITRVAKLLLGKETYLEWLDVKKQLSESTKEDFDILATLREWRSAVVVANGGKAKAEIVPEQPIHLLSPKNLSKLTIQKCPELTSIPFHPDVEELKLIKVRGALIQQSMAVAAPISPTTAATSSLPLPKLKSLEISSCEDLVSLPEGWLENLTSIECLVIRSCVKLESLSGETHHPTGPDSRTSRGKQLDLSRKEDNSQGFGNLRTLRFFHLPKLTSLPRWMQQLTALLTLKSPEHNFSDEENDKPGLRSLRWMQLSDLPELVSLPEVLQHAKALENLEITSCPGLMSLPDWFGNLTSLRQIKISHCNKLESLPEAMRGLSALQVLTIWKCQHLTETCQEDWPNISQIPCVFLDGKRLRSEESSSTSLPWKRGEPQA